MRLLPWEWLAILIAGGVFIATELLNTAIEHCADIMDDHHKLLGKKSYHQSIKTIKDVAAGASLVSLILVIIVTITVFWPYAELYVLN